MNSMNSWMLAGLLLSTPMAVWADDKTPDEPILITPVQGGAAKVLLPPKGVALGYEEARCIPDAFCEIEGAEPVDRIPGGKPRCCDDQSTGRNCDRCGQANDLTAQLSGEGSSSDCQDAEPVYLAVFDDAAHFSTASCTRYAQCTFETPYVIYEGMAVRIKRDGCYEVRALVDGPHIPAILRLQLQFSVDGNPATITLPPIRLSVDELTDNHLPNETHTWFVRRTGYSHRLSHLLADFDMMTVQRNGTAQIGQIPEL